MILKNTPVSLQNILPTVMKTSNYPKTEVNVAACNLQVFRRFNKIKKTIFISTNSFQHLVDIYWRHSIICNAVKNNKNSKNASVDTFPDIKGPKAPTSTT